MIRDKKYIIISVLLIALLMLSIVLSIGFGSMDIPIKDIYATIMNKMFNLGDISRVKQSTIDIVWLIRLPRTLLALAIGMGLSVTGIIMQSIVKNSLADPYILGVSSGASFGATLAIMLGVGVSLGSNYIGIAAFIGAFITSILVILLSNIGGRSSSTKLLLAGMAVSSIASAFSNLIIYLADNKDGIRTITYWMMGSLAGASWDNIKILIPIVFLSTLFFMTQYRVLNLMLLGDETATTLGMDLYKYRLLYLVVAALNVGFAVYAAGVIGFIGLIIPHIVRIVVGIDHKKTILISGLTGSIFLIWMDVLARTIKPGSEVPIGILVSIIGAPTFIYLMISKNYNFGGTK